MRVLTSLSLAVVLIVSMVSLYRQLLQQSKHPSGILGKLMMKIWNKTYLPLVKWSLADLNSSNVSSILDVGVGNGVSTHYLINRFRGSKAIGIDLSEVGIEVAQACFNEKELLFEVQDITKTNFDGEAFDLICAFQTHFHWNDLAGALTEVRRVLKSEGNLVIACESAKINYFLPEIKSKESFQAYLAQVGFRIVSMKEMNGWVSYRIKRITSEITLYTE